MQVQLVKQLESGQALNSKIKLFATIAISFVVGFVSANYLNKQMTKDPALTPRQKELQAIAIEAEKRPFFSVEAPVGKADLQDQ